MPQTDTATTQTPEARLNKYGYNAIARHISMAVIIGVCVFIGAGTWDWAWGWAFSIVTLLGWIVLSGVLAAKNPELLNQRGQRARSMEDTKPWDWVILGLYFVLLIITPLVAGFDHRYGWSAPGPTAINLIGCVILIASFVPLTWSMAVNRHFEGTVRIRTSREHQVVEAGPYRYVRHPGYVAVILQFIATPLFLGAWAALIPAVGGVVLFIIRTALEDRALLAELPGYADFARRTRFRLLPGVW